MADSLSTLIRDTLSYLKDPLFPKQQLLATAEDVLFFQKTPAPVQKTPLKESSPSFESPKEMPKKTDFSQIKSILQKTAPTLQLTDQVLPNSEQVANVILLACKTDPDTLEFLKNLSKAIDQKLAKAKILSAEKFEMDNRWDQLLQKNAFRLIIASEGMQKLPKLMQFYQKSPVSADCFLGTTPLLSLSAAAFYQSLEHKALLWKTLCQMLKKP